MAVQPTNRSALFAQINPEKPDFITLCGDTRDIEALDDAKLQEIDDALLVGSYQEFEEKMAPKIYHIWDANTNEPVYTTEKPADIPDDLISEISIGIRNPTTGMLFSMLDSHSASGTLNIHYNHAAILEQISPAKSRDAIQQIRKELAYNYQKYEELPPGDPVRDEAATTLNKLMEEARGYFSDPIQMLPLLITDSESRLMLSAGEAEDNARSEKIVAGVMRLSDDGSLKILEAPKSDEKALALTDGETSTALAEVIEQDYKATIPEEDQSSFMIEVLQRTFTPLAVQTQSEVDLKLEAEKYNVYVDLYTKAQSKFIETAKPIIEQMLGIYCYFKMYPVRSKTGMRPQILVLNCDPDMLARSQNIIRLETYLASVNSTNDNARKMWFAMVPNLSFARNEEVKPTREVFETVNKVKKKTDIVSLETLSTLISTLSDFDVKTFFSYMTGEQTTFEAFQRNGLTPFYDRVEPLMDKPFSAHAIPCLPNPTVIPKNKSGVVTGRLMESDGNSIAFSDNKEDIQRFWINGVYIPACYSNTGLYAAAQCPDALRHWFGKNVDPDLPGVRIDLESGNNPCIITTTLPREISGYSKTVKEEINRQRFGFILGSENIEYRGKKISCLTVYTARSLAMNGSSFEPIFQTQVSNYIEQVLALATGDNKEQNVRFFFSDNPASQMSQWKLKNKRVNAILQEGDEVSCEFDESGDCDLVLTFGGVSKNVKVKINRVTAKTV